MFRQRIPISLTAIVNWTQNLVAAVELMCQAEIKRQFLLSVLFNPRGVTLYLRTIRSRTTVSIQIIHSDISAFAFPWTQYVSNEMFLGLF